MKPEPAAPRVEQCPTCGSPIVLITARQSQNITYEFPLEDGRHELPEITKTWPKFICEGCRVMAPERNLPEGWQQFGQSEIPQRQGVLAAWCLSCKPAPSPLQDEGEDFDRQRLGDERQAAYATCLEAIRHMEAPITRKSVLEALCQVSNDDADWKLPKGTARAAREREWIPVKERLPELARKVLVYRDGSVCEGEYQGKFGWHVWATWRQDVTYWMPLPDPPEAALTENSNVR